MGSFVRASVMGALKPSVLPRVEFAMTDGHMRHYYADGKVEEVKWKAGDVKWSERATYQQENIGTSEFRVRVVQLK